MGISNGRRAKLTGATDIIEHVQDDAGLRGMVEMQPVAADDVAAAVCFLASDEASYITGHVLAVNGGMYT